MAFKGGFQKRMQGTSIYIKFTESYSYNWFFSGASVVKNPHANMWDVGSTPGCGISRGEGNVNPL